jgi:periplasmic protein TonB
MTGQMKDGEQREMELAPEPIVAPAMGSLLLHCALIACLLAYSLIASHNHYTWGNPGGGGGGGGAMQVNLVTHALPLPSDQPFNAKSVLATETPSPAPAEPAPKAKPAEDENAIPIASKQKKSPQQKQKPAPTQKQTQNANGTSQRQTSAQPNSRAQYGEQAGSSIPRAIGQGGYGNGGNGSGGYGKSGYGSGPVGYMNGNFGDRFGWYTDVVMRKMAANWNRLEVDPHTNKGLRAYIQFTIHRDGRVSDVRLRQASGSLTLDNSCLRAAQRIDTFSPLPAEYNQSTLNVSYYCEYLGR